MKTPVPSRCVFVLLLAFTLLASIASGDESWRPRLAAKDKDAETRDLGDPKALKDGDWLQLQYGEYAGYRSRLGVVVSEEKTAYSPKYKHAFSRMIVAMANRPKTVANPQNYIEDLVREALTNTHRFDLLERTSAAADIEDEQALGDSTSVDSATVVVADAADSVTAVATDAVDSATVTPTGAEDSVATALAGRVDQATAVRTGRMIGAEYIVKATLVELNPEKEAKELKAIGGSTASVAAFGDLGVKTRIAFCRLNLRVIRVETGEIVSDQIVDGTCTTASLTGITGFGLPTLGGAFRGKSKKEAPITNAMKTCASKAAYFVATSLDETVWMGRVADVAERTVTIAAGTREGLREGIVLTLLSKGAEVVDPETQEVIGSETSEIGQLRITSAQEQFATAEIVKGGEGAKKGDLVRREKLK